MLHHPSSRCREFDADKNGSIDASELYNAFRRFGYDVSSENSHLVLRKYSRQSDSVASGGEYQMAVSFDRFVRACAAVKHLHKVFDRKFENDGYGAPRIKFDEFLESVFSLPDSWDTLDEDFAPRTQKIIQRLERRLEHIEGHSLSNLKGKEALAMADFLQTRLDQGPDPQDATLLMRLLQDLCSSTNLLPSSCWLNERATVNTYAIKSGGEAVIYQGFYQNRMVAIRSIITPDRGWESPKGKDTIKLIQREILAHRQLKHPNVIPLIGVFQEDLNDLGVPLIVLPYYQNGSARSWFAENITPENYMRLLFDMTNGLSYLHGRSPPFIHGDLHADNVLIDNESHAVLCDFGFSRAKHEVTRVLTMMQTTENYRFLAPELCKVMVETPAEDPDAQEPLRTNQLTDIYALGMTFYQLGTLRYPFYKTRSPELAAEKALQGERPFQPKTLGGFSDTHDIDRLWVLITGMWGQDPESRLSLHEVHQSLLEIDPEVE